MPDDSNGDVPAESDTYLFDNYNDLSDALVDLNSPIKQGADEFGELFVKTLSAFEKKDIDLFVPVSKGSFFELRSREGYSNIALFTSELYNIPWIIYHCKTDGCDVDIKIAYSEVKQGTDISSAVKYADALNLLAPDVPSPNNYQDYPSYQKIYEKEITLADNVHVGAMVSELKDNGKIYVMFIYNDMLVSVYADSNILIGTFFGEFGFTKY